MFSLLRKYKFTPLSVLLIMLLWASLVDADSAYVGMQPQELPELAIDALGFSDAQNSSNSQKGVVAIRDVGRDTPAANAGVKRGDILLSIDGERIKNLSQLVNLVANSIPGDVLELLIIRHGKEINIQLTLGSWPKQRQITKSYAGQIPAIGIVTAALTQKIREQFGIRWDSEGVIVTIVDPSKGIAEVIKRGDVIVQFNQEPIWLPEQLLVAYNKAKSLKKQAALLLIERSNGYAFITLPVR